MLLISCAALDRVVRQALGSMYVQQSEYPVIMKQTMGCITRQPTDISKPIKRSNTRRFFSVMFFFYKNQKNLEFCLILLHNVKQ